MKTIFEKHIKLKEDELAEIKEITFDVAKIQWHSIEKIINLKFKFDCYSSLLTELKKHNEESLKTFRYCHISCLVNNIFGGNNSNQTKNLFDHLEREFTSIFIKEIDVIIEELEMAKKKM